MATQDELNALLGGVSTTQAGTTQGTTIQLDTDEPIQAKTPLTFEQIQEILKTGGTIPEGKTVPVSLSMKQYGQLPGGLSAYQNLQGYDMMSAIEGTAGTNTPQSPTEEEGEGEEEVIEVNCPDGYSYNPVTKLCEPSSHQDKEEPASIDAENKLVDASYNAYVTSIIKQDGYIPGNWESFKAAQGKHWLGKNSEYFYDNDKLYKQWGTAFNKAGTSYSPSSDTYDRTSNLGIDLKKADIITPINPVTPFDEQQRYETSPTPINPVTPFDEKERINPPSPTGGTTSMSMQQAGSQQANDQRKADAQAQREKDAAIDRGQQAGKGYKGGYGFNTGGQVSSPIGQLANMLRSNRLGYNQGGAVQSGYYGYQEGGQINMQEMGFVNGKTPDQVTDAQSVADTEATQAEEGDFVINAPAVEIVGVDNLIQLMSEALQLWLSAYGSASGDLALQELCSSGLWIAGGTAAKNLDGIRSFTFLNAFRNKGRFQSYLERIPLILIKDPEATIFSSACRAHLIAESGGRLN